jgi:MFS family permease
MLLTAMVARLPQGMSGLAVLILLTQHVGYGKAGVATGVTVASSGVSNVLLARAVDRVGARAVLIPSAFAYAALATSLAIARNGPYGRQLAICVVLGLVTPPITSVSRGTWPRLLGEERAQVLYGLEATAQELVFIAGPAIVALIAGLANPPTAVVTSGALGLVGALAYATAPPLRVVLARSAHRRTRVLFGTGLIWYVLVGGFMILGFTMTDIATVGFISGRKASGAAGVVLALWSVGSMLGGIRFGASHRPVTDRIAAYLCASAAVGLGLCAAAPDKIGLAVILFAGGTVVAPALARIYTRVGSLAPDGATTEAFGWLAVGFLIGSSVGSTIGGVSVQTIGARWTFLVAGAGTMLSVVAIAASVALRDGRQAPDQDAARPGLGQP